MLLIIGKYIPELNAVYLDVPFDDKNDVNEKLQTLLSPISETKSNRSPEYRKSFAGNNRSAANWFMVHE